MDVIEQHAPMLEDYSQRGQLCCATYVNGFCISKSKSVCFCILTNYYHAAGMC